MKSIPERRAEYKKGISGDQHVNTRKQSVVFPQHKFRSRSRPALVRYSYGIRLNPCGKCMSSVPFISIIFSRNPIITSYYQSFYFSLQIYVFSPFYIFRKILKLFHLFFSKSSNDFVKKFYKNLCK